MPGDLNPARHEPKPLPKMNRTLTVLLLAVGALVVLSLAMLASGTMLWVGEAQVESQAVACALGFVALWIAARTDYHQLQRWAVPVYAGTVLLLILTLSPLGSSKGGAQRWLWGVQPSEFAKVGVIVGLAWFAARFEHRMNHFLSGVVGMASVAALPLGFILLEPDKGTTALLCGVTFLMMVVAGVRIWQAILPAVLCVAVFTLIILNSEYAMKRVNAFLHPEQNSDGYHQVLQGLYAFGAGGVDGVGLGRGSFKYNIPEHHTDFIFPVVGEELGLPFTLAVVGVFAVILICGALITQSAPDLFGALLASGITFLICGQALFNLGVVTDLLPNKGIPLPLVSRGGTGVVMMLGLVGCLVSVARQAVTGASASRPFGNPFTRMDTELPE